MSHPSIKTPGGETLVILPVAEYEALRRAALAGEHAAAIAAIRAGAMETLSADEVSAALQEPSALAFWRKKRGLTQQALAQAAGISQSYVAGMEKGDRKGDPAHWKRFAAALGVRMEDIVAD
jgi:DNA-binding XRE family transcriptional regulator